MNILTSILWLAALAGVAAHPTGAPQSPLEKVFNRPAVVAGDVSRFTFPRADLHVKVGEVTVEPALALTSWVAFEPMGTEDMMMGDLVLRDTEVAPVMERLLAGGVEITALHNHLLGESPRIMYMHIGGQGDPVRLAESVRSALERTGTPLESPAVPALAPETPGKADPAAVESELKASGQRHGDMIQFGIPRMETITENGMTVPVAMGMATSINFQSVGDKSAVAGDFVLLGDEVNPVAEALTSHGISVTAIHNHMLEESPRLFFLHYWGYGDASELARGIRAALERTNSRINR